MDEIVVTAKRLPRITARIACELIAHEGIVREAYRDSKGIWTWGIGLATTGGYDVLQYKDKPASLETCIGAYLDAVQGKYLPQVLRAFPGRLEEHQLAALLSFHYNSGAIGRLEANDMDFMQWRRPLEIVERREAERDLYLKGKWSGDGKALVYGRVRKPSYTPDWGSGKRIEVRSIIEGLLP